MRQGFRAFLGKSWAKVSCTPKRLASPTLMPCMFARSIPRHLSLFLQGLACLCQRLPRCNIRISKIEWSTLHVFNYRSVVQVIQWVSICLTISLIYRSFHVNCCIHRNNSLTWIQMKAWLGFMWPFKILRSRKNTIGKMNCRKSVLVSYQVECIPLYASV